MPDTHAPNLMEFIRALVHNGDERRNRVAASAPGTRNRPNRRLNNRQIHKKRTFRAMFFFGLLLGGLELFIMLHYL